MLCYPMRNTNGVPMSPQFSVKQNLPKSTLSCPSGNRLHIKDLEKLPARSRKMVKINFCG